MDDLLKNLNPAQREAVTYVKDSPLMIIAGAGTGKTRVITHRIAFLHRECGIPLNRIMAVTFTNKAAREMRERVCRILGSPDSPSLPIGTFHSRCAMILRREAEAAGLKTSFAILDEKDQQQAIKRVLEEMGLKENKRIRPGQVQAFINQAKMKLLTPKDCKEEFDEEEIPYADIYEKYQKTIEKSDSVDFEDLLMKTVQLFERDNVTRRRWAERYQYLLVDEYQDTNHAQFLLTELLGKDHRQICIVGDEDQSIYSWRGAEIRNLLDFEKAFPGTEVVKLEQNYRSTGNILKAASTVIAHNTQRIGKVLYTNLDDGELLTAIVSPDQESEARTIALECARLIQGEGVDPNEIAVFYRGHWLSRSVEDQMRRYRIPYRIVGNVRFYDRAEIKDLLSFMRLAVNPDDDLAFERVVNRPTRGIGPKALGQIFQESARLNTSLYRASISLLQEGEMRGKARKGLMDFVDCIDRWLLMEETAAPIKVLEKIIENTDYKVAGVGDPNSVEGESRIENIEELEGMLKDFVPTEERHQLAEFLSSMALDATDEREDNTPKVNLLTIHNAKGLEFDYVFIIGLEKGVFPTSRSEESFEEYAIEEERRLFYVAITRAKRKLYLSFSMRRNRPDYWMNEPSMFLSELPPEVFEESSMATLRKILPYGWGSEKALGGHRDDGVDDIHYEMDEDEVFSPSQQPPRKYASMTRGLGRPRGPLSGGGAKPKFSEGMRVVHRYMGSGVVEKIGGRPGWERVYVAFDDGRSQEFVLKYAPLVPEEDR